MVGNFLGGRMRPDGADGADGGDGAEEEGDAQICEWPLRASLAQRGHPSGESSSWKEEDN